MIKNKLFQIVGKKINGESIDLFTLLKRIQEHFAISKEEAETIIQKNINEGNIIKDNGEYYINLLANTVRAEIFNLIKDYPGIYISEIKRQLKIGSNQTCWHLSILEEFGFIKSVRINKVVCYKIPEVDDSTVLIGFLMLKDTIRFILSIIASQDKTIDISSLLKQINIPRTSLIYWISNLRKMEIIKTTKLDKKNCYSTKNIIIKAKIQEISMKYNSIFV